MKITAESELREKRGEKMKQTVSFNNFRDAFKTYNRNDFDGGIIIQGF